MIDCSLDIPWSPSETCIWILCSKARWLLTCAELCVCFSVLCRVVRVDEDVVKVYDYRNVKHVSENIVHKVLECPGSIGESKRHDMPFKEAISGLEGCFPFIIFGYVYKMISMLKIKFGIDASRIEEVRNEWKGVMVFLGYLV